jgi:cytochrome c
MPDMAYSPALKAQEVGAMRTPPKGTIPRGYTPYAYANEGIGGGAAHKNPLPRTLAVLKRGQQVFNSTCYTCHGTSGMGDGTIVVPINDGKEHARYPRPPSLHSDKVRGWADGQIFHVITMGQNLMPSYASQIKEEDRWAIIHYIRALQRSSKPTPEDIQAYEREQAQ